MLRCYFSCPTLSFLRSHVYQPKSRLSAASLMAAGLRVLINRKGLYSSLNPSCTVRVYYSVHAFWRSPATHTARFPWPARHSVSRMSCSMLVRPKAISVFIFSALKQDCSKSLAIRLVHSSLSGGGRRRRPPELLVGHLSWAVPLARSEGFLGREALPTPRGVWSSVPPGLSRPFRRPSRSTRLQDRAGAGRFPRDVSLSLASGVFPEAAPAPLTEGNTSLGPGVEYAMRLELFTCRFGNSALGFLPCVLDCWSG